ncbi:MAG: DUF418 domain-containing protein [Hyphomonadaceae bacterium]|nr:DUF418 domain-containing protein [Hyphomonadaceae bacterium]
MDAAPATTAAPVGPKPVAEDERLALIDSLRGFALIGVYLINLPGFMLVSTLTPAEEAGLPLAGLSPLVHRFIDFFISGKSITLFSLLFGIGFAIQMERADKRGADIAPLYVRRLAILFAIGLAHGLLWMNDILHDYALLGLTLLFFRRASNVLLIGLGLFAAIIAQPLLDAFLAAQPTAALVVQSYAYAEEIFRRGDLRHALAANLDLWIVAIGNLREPLLFVFGRLLLGFWIGRNRILHEPTKNAALIQRLFLWSFAIGCGAQILASIWRHAFGPGLPEIMLDRTGGLAMGFSYAMGFGVLFRFDWWRRALAILAPAGRMALTNYLTQTLISLPLFYGFGLGVGPTLGWPGWLGVCATVFAAQLAFSHWWLARYRFGPAEWAWRSLTYGKRQTLAKAPART